MKILGIAAEYNPFHNGHKYHIEESKNLTGCDAAVAVMSGCFTQRGEPAVSDKWSRAEIAVRSGIDLVLELPFIYACNGAGMFSKGAVGVLDGLGCIDIMSFGSESGDISLLSKCAEDICKADFSNDKTYASNMGEIFTRYGISSDANNILAVEYLNAINETGSDMEPFTIKRQGRGYHIDGASSVRRMLNQGESVERYVPYTPRLCWNGDTDVIFELAVSEILRQPAEILDKVPSGGEGLGYKLKKEVRKAGSLEELIDLTRSSRYTRSRISRMLMQIIMGLYEMPEVPYYGRILAFNDTGARIIKEIKKNECQKEGYLLVTNINKQDTSAIENGLSFDIRACDMYNLIVGDYLYDNSDMVKGPVRINCR